VLRKAAEASCPLANKKNRRTGRGGTRGHGAGGGSNTNWVGTVAGEKCADLLSFLLFQKKKGGASHAEADDYFICGFNQCPSLSSAVSEHSVKGVLQNTFAFIIDRVFFFPFSFPIFIFFSTANALALS